MSLAIRCLAIRPRAAFLSFLVALYFFMAACAPDRSAVGAEPDTQGKAMTCADVPPGEQCGGGGAKGAQCLRAARRRRASEARARAARGGWWGGVRLRGCEALGGVDGEEALHELLGLIRDVVPPW
jgi:hypothetical protein